MKKIINKILVLTSYILILTSFYSCKKALDIEQKMNLENEKAITSAKDLEAVIVGAYDGLQSGNVFAGNMLVYSELLGDDAVVTESKLNNFGTKEIYFRATTVQINPLRDMWRDCYSTINRVNNVVYYLDNNLIKSADLTFENSSQFKGEALFIRATIHFEMMKFWALPYDVDKQGNNTQPGIPYRTLPTLSGFADLAMARKTVEEVYSLVIADLKTAAHLLDTAGIETSTSRASSMACYAYLARIYFQKGDYINAALYANKVINSDNFSLNDNIKLSFQTSGDVISPEAIFQLVNIKTDQSNAISYNFSPTDNTIPLFQPDTVYKKLFWDTKDQRRSKYISINPFAGTISVKKYRSANPSDNICILRLAEMHLIRAESNLVPGGNGNLTDAFASYNAIVKRAYGTNYVAQTVLAKDLLDSVRLERRRELCFENDRKTNQQRLKLPLRDGINWNDPSLLFKIPQEEMSGNPLMVQNP